MQHTCLVSGQQWGNFQRLCRVQVLCIQCRSVYGHEGMLHAPGLRLTASGFVQLYFATAASIAARNERSFTQLSGLVILGTITECKRFVL